MNYAITSLSRTAIRASNTLFPKQASFSTRLFSAQTLRRSSQTPPNFKQQRQQQQQNGKSGESVEPPAFNLESLGLSRNMKLLVLGIVSVFGTIETWFWCKAIWRWWKGAEADSSSPSAE